MALRRALCIISAAGSLAATGLELAPERPATDTYFGTRVVDPYRYMEAGSPAYATWKAAQVRATQSMLEKARARAALASEAVVGGGAPTRITDLTSAGGHVFFMEHTATSDALIETGAGGKERRTILTNATYAADGSAILGAFAVSRDASTIALHVYVGKSVQDVHVLRAADGADIEPPLHDAVFDYVGFTPDGRALTYARSAKTSDDRSIPDVSYDYLHAIGAAQSADVKIFGPGISPRVDVPHGAFAFVDATVGTQAIAEVRDVGAGGSRFYTAPLETIGRPDTPWRPLGTAADRFTDIAVHGTTVDLATDANAPNYAVVRASLVGTFAPRVVLPASDRVVVSGTLDGIPKAGIFALNAAADADYVQLLDGGVSQMVRIPYDANAKPVPVPLPLRGSILEVGVDPHVTGAFVHLTSWTVPGDVYEYDPHADAATPLGLTHATPAQPRVADEMLATADDGTPIAVSIVHRPGLALDGSHPAILRVAGAYGFSITPDYRTVPAAWIARDGIYAVAHVRGGGELGEAWHRAGMGATKNRTWTDLIAAANRLIERGYTSPKRLNLYGTTQSYLGGMASSIAIGRAIEERPDLFAAAVIDAPTFDMLRSEQTSLGRQSLSEFGSVATQPGFTALLAMSPYEHVRAGTTYPPILVRSLARFGEGDDWEAAKMVARLQSAATRTDVAFLDIPGNASDDRRSANDLRNDALAFFAFEDAAAEAKP